MDTSGPRTRLPPAQRRGGGGICSREDPVSCGRAGECPGQADTPSPAGDGQPAVGCLPRAGLLVAELRPDRAEGGAVWGTQNPFRTAH